MADAPSAEQLFGEICVRLFFCTRKDLDRALSAQLKAREAGSDPTIGQVMRGLSIITDQQVEAVLKAQEVFDPGTVETLYGRIALKNRFIRPSDLEDATKVQVRTGRRLRMGEILVKRGYLTWEQHEAILRAQERILRTMEARKAPDVESMPPIESPPR
jgi:hypothetical protein